MAGKNVKTTQKGEKQSEEDYYVENGFIVFTKSFLRRRGYCCKSGCRHCPYGYRKGGGKNPKTCD
ncbi:MAG: DUF5522 domain-containing protein [Saprospiraceae bacterium]|nr:DUF5522 domain-containing protein [Saprospiraceae bacterium]